MACLAPRSLGASLLLFNVLFKALFNEFFAGHTKQDSANQLNPDFACGELEAEDDAGRQTDVVLAGAEKAGVHVVAFDAYGDGTKEAIV
jgi:hypothetical protein